MQTGFAMLEAGAARAKNVKSILLKNLLDTAVGALAYFICGYAASYGDSVNNPIVGFGNYFFVGDLDWNFVFFQYAFASTAATIVSGSMAERAHFIGYRIVAFFMCAVVYPVVAHWIWSDDGFLRNVGSNGFIDFAGGCVVHVVGGTVGGLGAYFLGPRRGRFMVQARVDESGDAELGSSGGSNSGAAFATSETVMQIGNVNVHAVNGHNLPLHSLGVFILWTAFYGFNCGSVTNVIAAPRAPGKVAIVTTLCTAVSSLTALTVETYLFGYYSMKGALNGALAGLVVSTSCSMLIEPWASLVAGVLAAFAYLGLSRLLLRLQVDDVVDACPVHVAPGLVSALVVGLFATRDGVALYRDVPVDTVGQWGLLYGGGIEQLGVQFLGILCVLAWLPLAFVPIFLLLRWRDWLRVDAETELNGLDVALADGASYPEFH